MVIENASPEVVADGLAMLIASDLERSIANLGYLVGMGTAPAPAICRRAADRIVASIKDRALELLAERQSSDRTAPRVAP